MERLGDVIRELRLRAGKTFPDLAAACGVSERTIRRIESGDPPSLDRLEAIARALGVTVTDLVARAERRSGEEHPTVARVRREEDPESPRRADVAALNSILSASWSGEVPHLVEVQQGFVRVLKRSVMVDECEGEWVGVPRELYEELEETIRDHVAGLSTSPRGAGGEER